MAEVRCFGCGAEVSDVAGPIHAYMLSAPGCWELYGSLLAWRSTLAGDPSAGTGQFLIDTYPPLVPAPASFAITVAGIAAVAPEGRSEAILTWAGATWADWSTHHEQVRHWLADALPRTSVAT